MAQIIRITSEALQATVRRLLPSQQGFGEDLQASNVIQPIIDLTPTAEGTILDTDLARAVNFASTAFDINNTTTVLAQNPGFYRVIGTASARVATGVTANTRFSMSDGFSSKDVWGMTIHNSGQEPAVGVPFDFVVYLNVGETFSGITDTGQSYLYGSIRQIADSNGVVSPPTGFNPQ